MITHENARRIIQEHIAAWSNNKKENPWILLDAKTIEKDWGWVFFYTSPLCQETGDFRHAIAGNAPFIVERESGRVLVLGTAFRLDDYLDRYEAFGDPHFDPGPQVRLVECRLDVD